MKSGWRSTIQTYTKNYTRKVWGSQSQRLLEVGTNSRAETLEKNMATLSVDAQKRAEKDAQKKAAKAAAAEKSAAEAKASAMVTIKRIERNKRKYVTTISGAEQHGVDLKKLAKEMGKKFATGASVTKRADGLGDEITVQGDVADDVEEWMLDVYKDIPEDNIEVTEEKKKKAAPPAIAPQ